MLMGYNCTHDLMVIKVSVWALCY